MIKNNLAFWFVIAVLALIAGCADRNETQELKAVITLPSRDQEIWTGEVVYFKGAATHGTAPYSYCWDFGKTMPKCMQPETGRVQFDYEGAYSVKLIIKDSAGNEATDAVRIIVNPKS